ncbi:aromatic-amino-acid transaminase [Amylolactobacillus amylotrophicus DSM 20534]|uniref:Aminotransferase n=3 Tax=Amylolactobacillus TaxID=2767876 RepID=A0A0R1YLW7_9LACO|nr:MULTISPECIES: aminotransferase class I/II-fold pyridoxal phosphate-dependent enzyme [Amylolactobacillus]APT18441.1 aspartate aminotransferase [Amylolactobacillus amylophilus DSM 20533 = JCM 1125]KRK38228.1 aromatic-amino-acid transaminase [Amylolactobacillus amylotrophicus DSM 20534]KRM43130.1 aromatic-amino-acid transaminase [Amylolactobacillus amylophilus DSM 20533 = JCM 1125]GED80470.1 aminotransferase [Amylolactobacillus amylophilus]
MPQLRTALAQNFNQAVNQIRPSAIREFDQQISDIDGIIKLTLGQPDFNVPEHVKEAAVRSINENHSGYTPQRGIPELRQAISDYLLQTTSVRYSPESEIVVTVGASEAIMSSLAAILNPGDKVIVPTPAFPLYFAAVELNQATVIPIDTSADEFVLTPEKLQAVLDEEPRVKAIILNYPNNPTGIEYTEQELVTLANVLKNHDIYVIADEIYNELTYGVTHHSIAALLPEQTIVINGLSKSHSMTGYRLGYFAAPADFVTKASKVHAFWVTCPSNPAQYAALEALTNGLQDAAVMRTAYEERLTYIKAEFRKMGFQIGQTTGAFYLFAGIPPTFNGDSTTFALALAKSAKVGVIPGAAFGPGGERYIRVSYASSLRDLQTAVKRISTFLKTNTSNTLEEVNK